VAAALGASSATSALADPPAGYALLDPARAGAPLRRGDRGPQVSALQRALGGAGFAVAVDGVFGGGTEAAVRAFQAAHGCAVDGVVGRETMRAFDRVFAPASTPTPPPSTTALALPPRAATAPTGRQVHAVVRSLTRAAREAALVREVRAGNVPSFLRRLEPVSVTLGGRTIVYHVTPDYLAVGSDDDFVRLSLSATAAQAMADASGCLLPTARMVDQVFAQAAVRLAPQPLPPGPAMVTVDYFLLHEARVEAQRRGRPLGALTAGHKKDVVLTNRLLAQPGRVAIYGWHRAVGAPIQPLSLVHERSYSDYSHGVRLVHPVATVDGQDVRLSDVLRDPALAPLLSGEGVLRTLRAAP
jgi:hypothetical protein